MWCTASLGLNSAAYGENPWKSSVPSARRQAVSPCGRGLSPEPKILQAEASETPEFQCSRLSQIQASGCDPMKEPLLARKQGWPKPEDNGAPEDLPRSKGRIESRAEESHGSEYSDQGFGAEYT